MAGIDIAGTRASDGLLHPALRGASALAAELEGDARFLEAFGALGRVRSSVADVDGHAHRVAYWDSALEAPDSYRDPGDTVPRAYLVVYAPETREGRLRVDFGSWDGAEGRYVDVQLDAVDDFSIESLFAAARSHIDEAVSDTLVSSVPAPR